MERQLRHDRHTPHLLLLRLRSRSVGEHFEDTPSFELLLFWRTTDYSRSGWRGVGQFRVQLSDEWDTEDDL
jgi:hypothetical protein